jgi:Cytochrome c oxidase subunit IV
VPEELRFLLRSALYSAVIGVVYWFISYEWAGTVLLVGAGVATGALLLILAALWRSQDRRLSGRPWTWLLIGPPTESSDMTDETGRLPGNSAAPLTVGFGLALAGLGLVFGPALIVAAAVPILIGLRAWLASGMAEFAALEAASGGADAGAAATAIEKSAPSRPAGSASA